MKALATCLLLMYVSVTCRPVFPVLADGLAHLLWYESHVATVHLHDGSMHVHSEIADIAAEDSGAQDKAPTPAKSFKVSDFMAAHIVVEIPLFNIPFWDIPSGGLPRSTHVLVGLYSKKVPVPPPDVDGPSPLGPTRDQYYGRCWHPRQQQNTTSAQTRYNSQILSPYHHAFSSEIIEPGKSASRIARLAACFSALILPLSFFHQIFSQLLYENFPFPTAALGSAFYAYTVGFQHVASIFAPRSAPHRK